MAAAFLWGLGVSQGQRVYTTGDPLARLAILRMSGWRWVAGQHLAAMGTAAVPAGQAGLAASLPEGRAKKFATAAAGALLAGAPLFVWCLADRGSDVERFAYHRGAAWPFLGYSWLHVAALGLLSGALESLPASRPAAVATATSAPVFAIWLAAKKDIPPFVFYVVETGVAATLLRWRPASARS